MIAVSSPVRLGFACCISQLHAINSEGSFVRRELGVPDDLAPPLGIHLNEFTEFLWRAGHWLVEVWCEEFVSKIGIGEHALNVGVDFCNDLLCSRARRKETKPKRRSKARQCLGNGRQFGEFDEAL